MVQKFRDTEPRARKFAEEVDELPGSKEGLQDIFLLRRQQCRQRGLLTRVRGLCSKLLDHMAAGLRERQVMEQGLAQWNRLGQSQGGRGNHFSSNCAQSLEDFFHVCAAVRWKNPKRIASPVNES